MAFTPDGKYFAAADMTGSIAIWNTADGKAKAFVVGESSDTKSDIHDLVFSPDGRYLWSFGSLVQRWRGPWDILLQSRRETVFNEFKYCSSICISSDNRWIAASSELGKLRVWRFKDAALLWPPQKQTPATKDFNVNNLF